MATDAGKLKEGQEAQEAIAFDDFSELIQRDFKPRTDDSRDKIKEAVATLAQQALSGAVKMGDDVFSTVDRMVAEIDRKLSDQMNAIMHHPEFQELESAWRGLDYLVSGSETGQDLKIRVLNISRSELSSMFKQYRGTAWDQSPLFKKIYEHEFGQLGGTPYGAFVCDLQFDHTSKDLNIMKGLARIGAAAHAPMIAAADSNLIGMDDWTEVSDPRDLANRFDTTEHQAWNAFRKSDDSKYLALTMPRILGRQPYSMKDNPIEEFEFEEVTNGEHDKHLWVNSAYAMGVRINAAFREYGWCTRIRGVESGGTVNDLPMATFPTDEGGVDQKCPTEVAISDRREAELSELGLLPLIHRKGTTDATFIGAQTVHKPAKYDDPNATANARLAARLPYLFASCRFAHYLKCMVRDWVGGTREGPQLQADLSDWVHQYVTADPDSSSEETKARLPLKRAEVTVEADPENPGYYKSRFLFVPHHQLEGMDVSVSMVSQLPQGQG
ncbi:type VI secretion system contractile sheath large subunit [Erythrobacter sp. JK5]|uniref:type VI secretion system contractile sheath large subunit n=1 Tax=Erythrobacter sp. JK5 TaxID=2829500 RepID=UPI001BAD5A3C|nr:type VI secretion system contractile sheath large subunit [Erythrobacter sp. JK5]QUL36774.1 type VI secretion system contractile sheath large subunit [Erythrobacter sp. JK5]